MYIELPEPEYIKLVVKGSISEEDRPEFNDSVWYPFLAHPKYPKGCAVLAEFLFAELEIKRPNKAKKRAMEHLIFAHATTLQNEPSSVIAFGRANGFWTLDEAKNPYRIGRAIVGLIDALANAGYLNTKKGYYNPPESRPSYMWATKNFIDLLISSHQRDCPVEYHESFPYLRVNLKEEGEFYDAPVTEETTKMRENLKAYNELLGKTIISGIDRKARPIWANKPVYRQFNAADLSLGGRWYGGWWQNTKSAYRSLIKIDCEYAIELDFKAQHPYMLYGEFVGIHYNDLFPDEGPYTVYNQNGIQYPEELIKIAFLFCLNAGSFSEAYSAIHKHYVDEKTTAKREQDEERLTELKKINRFILNRDESFKAVYEDILRKHSYIRSYMCTGIGSRLQRLDSDIAEYVINNMTKLGVAILCVHDSFLVNPQYADKLHEVMQEAYYVLGREKSLPPIKRKGIVNLLQETEQGIEEKPYLFGQN